jgi:hypothetical protein
VLVLGPLIAALVMLGLLGLLALLARAGGD